MGLKICLGAKLKGHDKICLSLLLIHTFPPSCISRVSHCTSHCYYAHVFDLTRFLACYCET